MYKIKKVMAAVLGILILLANIQIVLCDDSIHTYSESQISSYYINPFYEEVIQIEDIKKDVFQNSSSLYAAPRYEKDLNALVASLRNNMVNRKENITLYFQSSVELDNTFLHNWIDLAVAETGNSKEGDYLKWHFGGASAEAYCKYYPSLKTYYYDVNIALAYYTTYKQEEEFDKTINLVLDRLNLKKETSDYIKVKAIYDYVCENVDYDYETLKDDTYLLKYSAYAALLNKTAVCQGYATLLYRLLEDSGIDNRVVVGYSDGQNHAWNLIKIYDKYYFADSTWDAGDSHYSYFLNGASDFKYHEPDVDFLESYPISDISYGMNFTDVDKLDWFYDSVFYNYENNLMTGMSSTTFGPFENLSRAQLASILYRMEGSPDVSYDLIFPDIPDKEWYTDAVLWASENKIVTGYIHSGRFEPHQSITREQVALMLLRYARFKGYAVDTNGLLSKYSDAASVSNYAAEAIQWTVDNGIISGKENGTKLEPLGQALRAECAVIIHRFKKIYK